MNETADHSGCADWRRKTYLRWRGLRCGCPQAMGKRRVASDVPGARLALITLRRKRGLAGGAGPRFCGPGSIDLRERYSRIYRARRELIDHLLVSHALRDAAIRSAAPARRCAGPLALVLRPDARSGASHARGRRRGTGQHRAAHRGETDVEL